MVTLTSAVLDVVLYCALAVGLLHCFFELMISRESKEDKVQTRQFMAIVYACLTAFCVIIAAMQWHSDKKIFDAKAKAKAARYSLCTAMTDDVNAYGSIDEFFNRRTKCELEFGKLQLIKSGKSVVWTN